MHGYSCLTGEHTAVDIVRSLSAVTGKEADAQSEHLGKISLLFPEIPGPPGRSTGTFVLDRSRPGTQRICPPGHLGIAHPGPHSRTSSQHGPEESRRKATDFFFFNSEQ